MNILEEKLKAAEQDRDRLEAESKIVKQLSLDLSEQNAILRSQLTAAQEENERLKEGRDELLNDIETSVCELIMEVQALRRNAAAQQSAQEQFRKGMERAVELLTPLAAISDHYNGESGCDILKVLRPAITAIRAELSKGEENEQEQV